MTTGRSIPTPATLTTVARLRARLAALEAGRAAGFGGRVFSLGAPALDAALPWGGLPRGAVHELLTADARDGAATGFLAVLLARLTRDAPPDAPVLWAGGRDDLYGPGLARFGLDPGRLLIARCCTGRDTLWAVEEGLRCAALAAAVGEVGDLEFTHGRRLQLAAAASGVPLFLLRPYRRRRGEDGAALPPSAALTRWRVESLASRVPGEASGTATPAKTEHFTNLIGTPRWRLALLRCRGGRTHHWTVEIDDQTSALRVAAAAGDRPHRQGAACQSAACQSAA